MLRRFGRIKLWYGGAATLVAVSASLVFAFSASSAAQGARPAKALAPIKIGLITEETGALASDFVDVKQDFLARIAYQNSLGGVDGHKLQGIVLDDQSTTAQNLADAQTLVADHVAVIDEESGGGEPGAAPYLGKLDFPVVGGPYSGPDWNTYKNMFSDWGRTYPATQAFTTQGIVLKDIGVTSLCSAGFGAIPSSYNGTLNAVKSGKAAGLTVSSPITTITPGGSTTTQALQIKNDGCNGLYAPIGATPEITLASEADADGAAGGHLKVDVVSGSYGVLGTPAATTMNGSVFSLWYEPAQFNTPATRLVNKELHKFGGAPGRPQYDFDLIGWLGANLAISALQADKANTNNKVLVKTLTNLKGYTAMGLEKNVSWSHPVAPTDLGAGGCAYVTKLEGPTNGAGTKFVPLNHAQPICGKPTTG